MPHKQADENSMSQGLAQISPSLVSPDNQPLPYSLPGTIRQHFISSAHEGGDEYCVDLYVPVTPAPDDGWPVIILLDAGGCFATCVEALGRLARRSDATGVRQAIVAGISSPVALGPGGYDVARRQRDFTSARPINTGVANADAAKTKRDFPEGGAAAFLDFIENDVLAFLSAQYPVDSRWRTLMGHSLAGYFTLWAMAHRPGLFRSYAAISPSLWWDWDGLVAALNAAPLSDQRAMIAVGEWEEALPPWQAGLPGSDEILARRKSRRMVGHARDMAAILANRLGADHVQFHEMPQEDHASIVSGAVPRMLRLASLR